MPQLTHRAQDSLNSSVEYAASRMHIAHGLSHMIHGLIQDTAGIPYAVLNQAGVRIRQLDHDLVRLFSQLPRSTTRGTPPYATGGWQSAMKAAKDFSEELGDEFLSTEHVLYGAVLQRGLYVQDIRPRRGQQVPGIESDAVRAILEAHKLTPEAVREAIEVDRKGKRVDTKDPEQTRDALKKYTVDLTAQAKRGQLDPVIGRDAEVRRCLEVLGRRRKNNPVLVGFPGVGKTVIADAIAQRIAGGDVPRTLQNCRLLALDVAAMVAGSRYRGSFEERLKQVLKDLRAMDGKVVLFIDELHNLVGAGRMEHGGMDAANMLKPALAKGELRCLGATTLDEYRTRIESDSALNRRFQRVDVDEPSIQQTTGILRGVTPFYEKHHGVEIRDAALVTAARLSARYIPDRYLPDKAVDLLDEAASSVRMGLDTRPAGLDALERKRDELLIEKKALARETDPQSALRLDEVHAALGNLDEELRGLEARWTRERDAYDEVSKNRERLLQTRTAIEVATSKGDLDRASELLHGTLPEVQAALAEAVAGLRAVQDGEPLLNPEVDDAAVAAVVARWTGIPTGRLTESATNRLLELESVLQQRVVGQPEPIRLVSKAVRRSRAGLSDPKRPIGSFLFAGPTGVGKTETAKALAEYLFDDEDAVIRLDMSEYMDKQSISRLTGAAPGLVGYDDGGLLTNAIRRKPYSVVLFDEIEKGHPDVFTLLLQILDEGRLTSSRGELCDFRNAVVILTTNIGAGDIITAKDNAAAQQAAFLAVQAAIRPEILGRLDAVVAYNRLDESMMGDIVRIQLRRVASLLTERDLQLVVDDDAVDLLARAGFNPTYGARPLKQAITTLLRDPLAESLLQGEYQPGDAILVGVEGEESDGGRRITLGRQEAS